jgi:carboxymethylenebutenolidase
VVTPDLNNRASTKDPDKAGKLMQTLSQHHGLSILDGAIDFLKTSADVDVNRLGVTVFCMGGTYSLSLVGDCFS